MIEIYIDLTEVKELAKKYGRAPEILQRETLRTMHEVVGLTERAVVFSTPVGATGELRGSIEGLVTETREGIEGRVAVTGPAMAYVDPVEFGSRPHWPPVDPIRFWVLRKLGVPVDEVPSVAFLVSRKISRVGTPAQKMFSQGWLEAEPKVMSMFAVMCYRAVEGIEKG